jgi:hypothetical protein
MSGFGDAPTDSNMPMFVSATIGTDLSISDEERQRALRESLERVMTEHREVADALLNALLIDGMEHRIQPSDILALCAKEKTPRGRSPMLMRAIIVEFLLVLREG